MIDQLNPVDACDATITRGGAHTATGNMKGVYDIVCYGPDGQEKWREVAHNVIAAEGKNYILDNSLHGSSFTTTGPKMGLITNTSYTTTNAPTNTYAAHVTSGWTESTAYAARLSVDFSGAASAGSKTAAAVTFSITGSDTVKGCCVFFTSVTTVGDVAGSGTLLSAGLFTGGDKTVGSSDSIQVTYTISV